MSCLGLNCADPDIIIVIIIISFKVDPLWLSQETEAGSLARPAVGGDSLRSQLRTASIRAVGCLL